MNKNITKKAQQFSSCKRIPNSNFENRENESFTPNTVISQSPNPCLFKKNHTNALLTSQKKNLDVGDLHILILNQEKDRELLNFKYCANSSSQTDLFPSMKAPNDSQKLEKKHQGTIKIKIFEDKLGKRSYEFVMDFPKNLTMKSQEGQNGYMLQNPDSRYHLAINKQKTENDLREFYPKTNLLKSLTQNNSNNFSSGSF